MKKLYHYFSTTSVKNKILQSDLSEGQLFFYVYWIITSDALAFLLEWLNIAGSEPTGSDLLQAWGTFLFTALGLPILYIINGGRNGSQFISKYFAFSFTVGFKYAIAFVFLYSFPEFISLENVDAYYSLVFLFLNTLMIAHIAYRIKETRS